jgi:hypothetical protein
MSDDEYIGGAYSPYSDYDDIFYDADPDLADDLAAHTLYSPILEETPGGELADYHSDWDYYSDDYFDDDPSILKDNPPDGSPIVTKHGAGQRRGKKRKLVDVADIPDLDLGERRYLKDCMRGTVWAKSIPERDNWFSPGKAPKIALLKDWKNVFGTRSVQDKGINTSKSKDESWANDLSLSDMGLLNERGKSAGEQGDGAENDEEDDAQEGQGMQLDEQTMAALIEEMENMDEDEVAELIQKFGAQMPGQVRQAVGQGHSPVKRQHPLAETTSSSPPAEASLNPLPAKLQRGKRQDESLPSPPHTSQSFVMEDLGRPPMPTTSGGTESKEEQPMRQGRGREASRNGASSNGVVRNVSASTDASQPTKKRKASQSPRPRDHKDASRSTASSRAKRVASNRRGSGAETKEKENSGLNGSTRTTRSRKKQ